MNLFDYPGLSDRYDSELPLAARMRPQNLDEFIGQEEILGPGKLLRRAIETDTLSSLILYGPPGSGKTSLAEVISRMSQAEFIKLNSVTSGVKELRETIQQARERRLYHRQKTILFIDEIHHLNKSQQDILLPAVEDGIIILIGATTENPYFEVNSALLSRSRVFRLRRLTTEEIKLALQRALQDEERGLGQYSVEITEEALDHLANIANGDIRNALSALEMAVMTTPPQQGVRHINLTVAEDAMQRRAVQYDRHGDQHYDVISAFIKSVRGSDPDAALYWLALMLYGGEDPRFIVRRLIILASEDIGLADPQAMLIAQAAASALEWVGMPEARIPLAEATIYLSLAPKSNSAYLAIERALHDVETKPTGSVPAHLRDSHYPGARQFDHGAGYRYPHDYPGHVVKQEYLPKSLKGSCYYHPSDQGWEAKQRRQTLKPNQKK
ncbi:MAG: replication-associated recombination protein A [Syntrophomonadaceae bacterium]|nr:replication-associated recombination protein A [Syntrophomonadaceae bacterium]